MQQMMASAYASLWKKINSGNLAMTQTRNLTYEFLFLYMKQEYFLEIKKTWL